MDEENTETIAKRVDETNNTAKTTPPTKPTSDTESGENGAMPAGPGEMGEMPEMNCEESESGEANCEPPTPPESMEGFEGGPMGGGGFPGDTTQQTTTPSDNVLHPVAHLSLGAGSVILSTVIMYACFSNFFHKKPAATFNKWQKFMWFIIAALIMSAALIILCYFVPTWIS